MDLMLWLLAGGCAGLIVGLILVVVLDGLASLGERWPIRVPWR